jgi:hypothetical protein
VAIVLLLAQQAVLAHAISHLGELTRNQAAVKTVNAEADTSQQNASDFCAECLAFAQLAASAPGGFGVCAVVPPAVLVDVSSSETRDCPLLVSFLARAPPVVA